MPPSTQIHDRVIARLVTATSIEREWLGKVWIYQRDNWNPKSKDRQHNDQMK
jgi:hypothetical protein